MSDERSSKIGMNPPHPGDFIRIEKAFDVSMDMLLRMQAWYDSYAIRQRADDIEVQRYEPA